MKGLIETRTGSDSDWKQMQPCYELFQRLEIPYTRRILSAHRTPDMMISESKQLDGQYSVCIAAAGGAAHLPGMTASETTIPIIGVPISLPPFNGIDSLLSEIQMPEGVPIGVVKDARDAAIHAAQIAYQRESSVRNRIRAYKGLGSLSEKRCNKIAIIRHDRSASEKMYKTLVEMASHLGLEFVEIEPSDGLQQYSAAIAYAPLEERSLDMPGRLSCATDIPVVTLPVSKGEGCLDRLIQILSHGCMSVGVDRPKNAAIFCCQILALHEPLLKENLSAYRDGLREAAMRKDSSVFRRQPKAY